MRFWIARGIPVNSWIPLPFAMHLASKGAFTVYMLPDDMSLLPSELVPVGVRTCGATFLRSMPVQCGIPLPVNRALVNFTLHRSLLERQSLKARGKKKKGLCSRIVPCFLGPIWSSSQTIGDTRFRGPSLHFTCKRFDQSRPHALVCSESSA